MSQLIASIAASDEWQVFLDNLPNLPSNHRSYIVHGHRLLLLTCQRVPHGLKH